MSQLKKNRIRAAINELRGGGVTHPSASQISHKMGRLTPTLNGEESAYRREILHELDLQADEPTHGGEPTVVNESTPTAEPISDQGDTKEPPDVEVVEVWID